MSREVNTPENVLDRMAREREARDNYLSKKSALGERSDLGLVQVSARRFQIIKRRSSSGFGSHKGMNLVYYKTFDVLGSPLPWEDAIDQLTQMRREEDQKWEMEERNRDS